MTQVFTAQGLPEVKLFQGLLEVNGIPCTVRNEFVSIARGEIPYTDSWPELWVLDDSDLAQARALIDGVRNGSEVVAQPWACPDCGEVIEGQFTTCWNCGTDRPA
jgi:hypothetical protein